MGLAVPEPASVYTKTHPYAARLVINRRLSGTGSGKDIRQFALDLGDSGIAYTAGDSLGIWPQNSPAYVTRLIQALRLSEATPVIINGDEYSLAQALLLHYESARPGLEVLHFIAERSKSKSLGHLLALPQRQQLQQWLYGRQLLDILHEYPIHTSAADFLAVLKPLQPRVYSIASSPLVFPREVHLTVSVVRYPGIYDGGMRSGVGSTFLADRAQDMTVPVFVQPNHYFHIPEQGDKPIIMVGPGTGVAPFRGFLQEREARGHTGKNWLFFGEQHAATDFYYRDEWQRWQAMGLLNPLSLAFSRDQAQKIYVQDRMREQGRQIWQWLEDGACFYVCGDAGRMAKAVHQTLHDIIQQHGKLSEGDTANYIRTLSITKRYLRDVY